MHCLDKVFPFFFLTKTAHPSQTQTNLFCLLAFRNPCPSSSSFRFSSLQSAPCPRQKIILLFPFYSLCLIYINLCIDGKRIERGNDNLCSNFNSPSCIAASFPFSCASLI